MKGRRDVRDPPETRVGGRWIVPFKIELVEHPRRGLALEYHELSQSWMSEWSGHQEGRLLTEPPEDLLPRFLRLFGGRGAPENWVEFAEKRGDRVLRFARDYGVLRLCKHGLVPHHRRPYGPVEKRVRIVGEGSLRDRLIEARVRVRELSGGGTEALEELGPIPPRRCRPMNPEPLRTWWELGRVIRGTWRVAVALKQGRNLDPDAWAEFTGSDVQEAPPDQSDARSRVEEAVRFGLLQAASHPEFIWRKDEGPTVVPMVAHEGLYGELWKRLAFAISGDKGFMVCDGCQEPYIREKRRPKPGQNNYCPECRHHNVPGRVRQQRWRNRQHAKAAKTD